MNTDLMSCAKCGHTLMDGAEACAYCGTAVAAADSPPQPDEKAPELTEQAAEPRVVSADDSPLVLDTTEASAGTPEASEMKSEAAPSDQGQSDETRQVINESAAEVASETADSLPEADDLIDSQLPDDELIVDFGGDETSEDAEQPSRADSKAGEPKEPDASSEKADVLDLGQDAAGGTAEVIPLSEKVSAKASAADAPDLPQTPVLEVGGEDPSESETLGADILELVEDEASEPESTPDQPSESVTLPDEAAVEKKVEAAPDVAPDESGSADGEVEAILLTTDDEVQSENPPPPADAEETVKAEAAEKPVELTAAAVEGTAPSDDSSASGDAQAKADVIQKQTEAQASLEAVKIDKVARGLAVGGKAPEAGADAQSAKKQKAALAKAQALKKKKLKLAKAQALKRKKAALLKAQALKKKKEAQAGVEKADKAMTTGANMVQSMEANTKILGLLKKYEGQTIGINYDNSADIKEAELVEANDEFFSVFVKDQDLTYCHPLKTILTIIEGKDGVGSGKPEQEAKFNAVVKVYPLVLF